MQETETACYRRRLKTLHNEWVSKGWQSHCQEVVDYVAPFRGRYLNGTSADQKNDGSKKHQKIINNTASRAAMICANGLNSGLTPHWSPWFLFTLQDEDLAEFGPVREWLHNVRNAILTILSRSNFYSAVHDIYQELVHFGTGTMIIDEDLEEYLQCRPLTVGEYYLSLDGRYKPGSLYRQLSLTAGQIRELFGQGKDKLDGLPKEVVTAIQKNQIDQNFEVGHVIEKASFTQYGKADYRGWPYKSCYFPLTGDENVVYRKHGYRSRPFIAARLMGHQEDAYGYGISMETLGDIKGLQQEERDKLEALRKMIRPPMNGPASMKTQGGSILSAAINWIPDNHTGKGFTPAYQVDPRMHEIRQEIAATEERIRDSYYVKMFLAVLGLEKRDVTAYEIAKRYEEKAIVLGPMMERLDSEVRSPTIERVFSIATENFWLPPPPPDLPVGTPIRVEYISSLSQAQKVVQGQPLQEFIGVVGGMIEAFPEIRDKIDADEVVDQLGVNYNVPPKVIRSDDRVIEIRTERAKAEQAQQLLESAKPVADAVKALGNTPQGESTVLDQLTGQ